MQTVLILIVIVAQSSFRFTQSRYTTLTCLKSGKMSLKCSFKGKEYQTENFGSSIPDMYIRVLLNLITQHNDRSTTEKCEIDLVSVPYRLLALFQVLRPPSSLPPGTRQIFFQPLYSARISVISCHLVKERYS